MRTAIVLIGALLLANCDTGTEIRLVGPVDEIMFEAPTSLAVSDTGWVYAIAYRDGVATSDDVRLSSTNDQILQLVPNGASGARIIGRRPGTVSIVGRVDGVSGRQQVRVVARR